LVEPDRTPHGSPPSLWPVGFALGIAVLLVGLIIQPFVVAPLGALLAIVFGLLWVRDVTREHRGPVSAEPVVAAPPPAPVPTTAEGFPRSKFLEAATLGLGGVIGGLVTVPAIGFMILPAFLDQEVDEVDVGALDDYAEGQWLITTFLLDPAEGEVTRRTAYIRSNGLIESQPSFTILSSRCVHLGCPVQANGLPDEKNAKTFKNKGGAEVRQIPVQPTGFGCPCHGGQYDNEGNRKAGPPVRALDRYEYAIRDSRLYLRKTYSVSWVKEEGAKARIKKYGAADPGQHVDGIEQILYPIQPEQITG